MSKKPVRPLGMVRTNSAVPFANPYTERYSRGEENRKLVEALTRMKPSIDNKSPKQYAHLQDNKKKEWLADERYAQIERENTILLERLCDIAKPRSATTRLRPSSVPGIALDAHTRPVIDNQETTAKLCVDSINAVGRKKELRRILDDNQAILRRIYTCRGVYSADRWRRDGEQQQKYALMRSRYVPPAAYESRPGTSRYDPQNIYHVRVRPATAVVGGSTRLYPGMPGTPASARGPASAASQQSLALPRPQTVPNPSTSAPRPGTAAQSNDKQGL